MLANDCGAVGGGSLSAAPRRRRRLPPLVERKPIPMGMNEWTGQTLLAADAGIVPDARGRGEDASEEGAEQAGGLGGRGGC